MKISDKIEFDLHFSEQDLFQIGKQGISKEDVLKQIQFYTKGISKTFIVNPAKVGAGIIQLSQNQIQENADFFDENKSNLKLIKFVPASGAATRMFKFLSEFLNDFDIKKESINAYINRKKASDLSIFIVGMDKFPFFDEVYLKLKEIYPNFDYLESDYKNYYFIKTLLGSDHFNYANKPKAILPFHQYENRISTPIEEHLYECVSYASSLGKSNLHFTLSEVHQKGFDEVIHNIRPKVELETQTQIEISFSYQQNQTDILAVDANNYPFRDENGNLVFRPGGHGALIENLKGLDGDLIFIKNIDNVIQRHQKLNDLYKKALAGILIKLQKQIFEYLNKIDKGIELDHVEVLEFLKVNLNLNVSNEFSKYTYENQINTLKSFLNRPIRVCGMVKNEGDSGGGPFWIMDSKGEVSLQIVETSQIDLNNVDQATIFSRSTHFNPVDLVCGIYNYKKEKFNLLDFVDQDSGFIVQKTLFGRPLTSYELPGLWNGAMAKWLTVFVEVPIITFNPVKTVNDLLRPVHQPK